MASQVVDRFARVARDQPTRTVLIGLSEDRSLTCADLWTEYEAIRASLSRAGLTNASLLISMAGNRTGFLSLLLACLDLGVALMPVDRGMPMSETLALVDRWHASALVLQDPPAFDRAHLTVPLPNGTYLALFPTMTPEPSLYAGASVMKLTSGSTGLPKATRTTETHLLEDSARIVEAMDIRPADTQLAVIPLSHAYGLGNLAIPVLMQGTAIVLRDAFAPAQVLADARAHNVRVFPGVPFMFEHLLTTVGAAAWPSTLEQLISAGARLELDTVKAFHARFGRKIHSFYGTSETGGISFDDLDKIGDVQTVGRPLSGVRVRVRDEGRLHVASSAVSAGYAGLPPLEQEGFMDGGFLTGDLGHINDHGHVVLTGRVSSFINVAGRKVQPDEVETVLREMPDVTEVKVLGVPDPQRGEILAACIASRDARLRALDVRRFCAMRLAAHKVPRVYVFFEELPRDERGKTARRVLEDAIARELAAE